MKDRGAWRVAVHGVGGGPQKVGHALVIEQQSSLFTKFHP